MNVLYEFDYECMKKTKLIKRVAAAIKPFNFSNSFLLSLPSFCFILRLSPSLLITSHYYSSLTIVEFDPHSSSFLFTISPPLLYPLHVIYFFLHNHVTSSLAGLLSRHLYVLLPCFLSLFRYLSHLLLSKRHLFTLYLYLVPIFPLLLPFNPLLLKF